MSRTDKYKKSLVGSEVDLIPFMNLLAILIPALLISTEYIKVATIAVSSPRIGPKAEAVEKTDEKPPLNLTLAVSSLGIYIASANNVLPGSEEQTAQTGPTIPKVNVKVYKGRNSQGRSVELMRIWTHNGKKYTMGTHLMEEEELNSRLENYKNSSGPLQITEELDHNYPLLNEKLQVIKKAFPDEKQVMLSSDPNILFTTIIRVMDTSRSFINDANEKEFLFPQVVLTAGVV